MGSPSSGTALSRLYSRQWLFVIALLGVVLAFFFRQSFEPHEILFANDGPLGALKAEQNQLPSRFLGTWHNLAWLGGAGPSAAPTITSIFNTIVPAELSLKLYAPLTLLFLGFAMWAFLRSLQFNQAVAILGGLAACLNMHFFSIACWGLGTWNIAAGMTLLAMAAVTTKSIRQPWAQAILCGLAVGMAVMEGYDIGAILSMYAGAFVIFNALLQESPPVERVFRAVFTETLVVFFAAFIATHTISSLVETQIQGVAAMDQDVQTKQQRWNSATQWSLPKAETLQLIVPGLFGYRMFQHVTERDHSSSYWGKVGQDPRIAVLLGNDAVARKNVAIDLKAPDADLANINSDDPQVRFDAIKNIVKKSGIYWRYRGTGEFAGIMVAILAFFGIANVCRRESPFTVKERWLAAFFAGASIFSLMAAWGRYGFLYQWLYHLPYFSTIRNPIKFLHPFGLMWILLAAFGMEALHRRYLRAGARRPDAPLAAFDKRWLMCLGAVLVVGIAGYFVFTSEKSKIAMIDYLVGQTFNPNLVMQVTDFAQGHVLWFLIYFAVAGCIIFYAVTGGWSGAKMKWAWIAIGIFMICDLGRADLPWIRYFNYAEKYSPNAIVDFLQDRPYEHRVIGKLEPKGPGSGITPGFGELYFFWIQNDFPYHNIQTLDFAQAPHLPDLDRAFLKAFELHGVDMNKTDLSPATRLWRLTNTRYLLATANAAELLNSRIDPGRQDFRILKLFNMVRKPGVETPADYGDVTIEEGPKGSLALIEFTNALPRAKLFASWEIANDTNSLQLLASPAFDPWQTVLVSDQTPAGAASGPKGIDAGTVTITDYHPKSIQMEADAKAPAILWLADRFAPDWKVKVDGAPAKLLRCNYIMRGVYLTPGHHVVEMKFRPSLTTLYISLAAIICGLCVAGYVVVTNRRPSGGQTIPTPVAPVLEGAVAAKPAPTKPGAPAGNASKPQSPATVRSASNKSKPKAKAA